MENALNLDTVKLAENKKEIVILDQTLLPNQCKYLNISTGRRHLGSNLFTESKRSTGDWRYRRICLLCTCKSDRNRR